VTFRPAYEPEPAVTDDLAVDDLAEDDSPVTDDGEQVDAETFQAPAAPMTGDAAVDETISRLALATGRPLADQVAVYDDVHRTLTDRLADVGG
jgi:hypothetical protein